MIAQIFAQLSPEKFYKKILNESFNIPANRQLKVSCPFHEKRGFGIDRTGSMGIDLRPEKGGRFNCLGCHAHGSNYLQFYALLNDIPWKDNKSIVNGIIKDFNLDHSLLSASVIDSKTLDKYIRDLNDTTAGQKLIQHLLDERKLTVEAIANFKLGYDKTQNRLAIPIFDAANELVNIRFWLPKYERETDFDESRKVLNTPGLGTPARLFPINNLSTTGPLYICEGELDAILLTSLGLPAITGTAGVNAFSGAWIKSFIKKDVVLILDSDHAGQTKCDELIELLLDVVNSIKPISIKELIEFPGKDVTDFFRAFGREEGKKLFLELIANQHFFYEKDENEDTRIKVNLFQSVSDDILYRDISVTGVVIGKATTPFAVESRFKVRCCNAKPVANCPGCPHILNNRDTATLDIDLSSQDVPEICYQKNSDQYLKKKIGITCNKASIELESPYINFEEITIAPDMQSSIQLDSATQTFYQRNALVKSYDAEMGGRYLFKGRAVQGPDKRVILVLTESESLNRFTTNLTSEDVITCDGEQKTVYEHLKIFQPDTHSGESVDDKLDDIYLQLTEHVTKIVGRRNILQAVDLTFNSALGFYFGEEFQERGWISTLIVGDSQSGKTETIKLVCRHYRAGDIHTGEHMTPAGIVGSYSENEGKRGRQFRSGVAPRNDGRILIIDEVGAMKYDQIGLLTSMRSSGKVRSTKDGQDNEYWARVRMIMVGNPHDKNYRPKAMRDYSFGCQAIPDIIGEEADITRFDIVTVCNVNEVPFDLINEPIDPTTELIYTSDKCNLRTAWIWSLDPRRVKFTKPAELAVRKMATKHATSYDDSLPIVSPGSQRWTIARIAVSIAATLFSTTNGDDLIVDLPHVEAAEKFILATYNSKAMGYDVYSSKKKIESSVTDITLVTQTLDEMPYELYLALKELDVFTLSSLVDYSTIERQNINLYMKQLRLLHCVTDNRYGKLVVSPGFRKFLREEYEHPSALKLMESYNRGMEDEKDYFNTPRK